MRGLPGDAPLHEARVGVVLDVVAVNEVLHVKEGLVGALVHLHDRHLEDVHLLGRVVPVELLRPKLGVHLKADVVEVGLALHVVVHVPLGHVVVAVAVPVSIVAEVTQFFPENVTKFSNKLR